MAATSTTTTPPGVPSGGSSTCEDQPIDPLDAYMASIDSEITHQAAVSDDTNTPPRTNQRSRQATTSTTQRFPTPASHGSTSLREHPPPSAAQLVVAKKVAASPFCDVLRRQGGVGRLGAPRGFAVGVDPDDSEERGACGDVANACLNMLLQQPAEFLCRYGHILSPADLESLPPSQDPDVAVHVARLQTLMSQQQRQRRLETRQHEDDGDDVDMMPAASTTATDRVRSELARGGGHRHPAPRSCPPDGARARNRRYRRLQQLGEGGVWFSDEAMKERDPWLWYEYVGKREGEEKPAPKGAVEQVPGSTSVGTYLQESLGFLSQQQEGEWPTGMAGADAGAGGRRTGPSLGMAFLSGVCTRGDVGGWTGGAVGQTGMAMDTTAVGQCPRETGTREITAGETVDLSDVMALSRAVPGVPIFPNGARESGSRVGEDSSTAAVTAAVGACSIRDSRDDEAVDRGCMSGDDGVRRVRFVDSTGAAVDAGQRSGDQPGPDYMQEQEEDEEEEEEEEDEEEEEGEGEGEGLGARRREEVARILSERFLAGEEDGVNYEDVDGDERLDDLDQLTRDEQDRWFRAQGDGAMD